MTSDEKYGENVEMLSPDGYSRFYVMRRIVEEFSKVINRRITILDVGGCSPYLYDELKKNKVNFELTILDILPKPKEIKAEYIQSGLLEAGLKNSSFDIVITTDTLEHIPNNDKQDFIRALINLSRYTTVIAAPFDTAGVHDAEISINNFNKKLFGSGQNWLEEHFLFGKPKVKDIQKIIKEFGYKYEQIETNNLYSWTFSSHINLIQAKIGLDQKRIEKIYNDYNKAIQSSVEFDKPGYRQFFIVHKEQKELAVPLLRDSIGVAAGPATYLAYLDELFSVVYDKIHQNQQQLSDVAAKELNLVQRYDNLVVQNEKNKSLIQIQEKELTELRPLRKMKHLLSPHKTLKKVINKARR